MSQLFRSDSQEFSSTSTTMRVPTTMLKLLAVSLSFLVTSSVDKFNYDKTDWESHDYGPEDWGNVECDDVATCVSFLQYSVRSRSCQAFRNVFSRITRICCVSAGLAYQLG